MSTSTSAVVSIAQLPPQRPAGYTAAHHVRDGTDGLPTSFVCPWPSAAATHSLMSVLQARFFNNSEKNFVPVPADRAGLVQVMQPTWGRKSATTAAYEKLKATWIGHASFFVEFPAAAAAAATSSDTGTQGQGVRVALDPVFSERMSPVSFLGPKRFTPPPCELVDLPSVDLVCISHNHYDHMDSATIKFIHQRGRGRVKFLCGLGSSENLEGMGVQKAEIVEMDWWDSVRVRVVEDGRLVGELDVVCTPSQHNSGRGVNDRGKALWCSFVFREVLTSDQPNGTGDVHVNGGASGAHVVANTEVVEEDAVRHGSRELTDGTQDRVAKSLFFAGDTAYRTIPQHATEEEIAKLPVCSAFKEIGQLYGPFDLSLLPIGCYSPRWWMSTVHCAPEDSICIHKDIKSKKSIGMHYGTVRGGISQYYEDVTEPPKRWKEACEKEGLKWDDEIGLCSVGETLMV